MMQPNMSTAITIVGIILGMVFVAGLKIEYFASAILIGSIGGVALLFTGGGGYRLDRVKSFMDPFSDMLGDGFQVAQSLMAMGSGGVLGRGLGDSIQKTLYLPEPQNDFILAIIGEELGFVGTTAIIILYVLLIWRGLIVAIKAPDKMGTFLASGVIMMIGIQLMLNIAVVTASMPPTGVNLPFISYGGNAMLMLCISMGIVFNVSRQSKNIENKNENNPTLNKQSGYGKYNKFSAENVECFRRK